MASKDNSIQPYDKKDKLVHSNSPLVELINGVTILTSEIQARAVTTEIELTKIRPRETQALLDELKERHKQGNWF